ncbi:hypothetical protein ACFQL1_01715 [Halomicroarcula sp. GCM10025709]|uniref:hypothetical protein n=1 Tax=Haloarcula TaxID=2237 RepID=UPI0024C30749|nr:hypothetical protein [Halomicroarcula sp. YJ-61-S]
MTLQHETEDHFDRIASALEDHRDQLEAVAESDTTFAPRAEAALEWLAEHTQEDDDGE